MCLSHKRAFYRPTSQKFPNQVCKWNPIHPHEQLSPLLRGAVTCLGLQKSLKQKLVHKSPFWLCQQKILNLHDLPLPIYNPIPWTVVIDLWGKTFWGEKPVVKTGSVQESSGGGRTGRVDSCIARKFLSHQSPVRLLMVLGGTGLGDASVLTGTGGKKCWCLVHIFSKIPAGKEWVWPQLCPLIYLKEVIPTG